MPEIQVHVHLSSRTLESLRDSHFRCSHLYVHRCSHFGQLTGGQMNNTVAVTLWPRLGFTVLTFPGMPAPRDVCLYFTRGFEHFLDDPGRQYQAARG